MLAIVWFLRWELGVPQPGGEVCNTDIGMSQVKNHPLLRHFFEKRYGWSPSFLFLVSVYTALIALVKLTSRNIRFCRRELLHRLVFS